MNSHTRSTSTSRGGPGTVGAHQRSHSRTLRRPQPERQISADNAHAAANDPYFTTGPNTAPVTQAEWAPSAIETGHGSAFPPRRSSQIPMLSAISGSPDGSPIVERPIVAFPPKVTPTWSNMPNKVQLAILALSRFVDFFQMAALQVFMVHQLKSFDSELSDVVISHQAGILQGSFTAAQIVTSILWGRAADQPMLGRKTVLLIGLVGTGFGCIGLAFSTTYAQAVFWRLMSGAINGTVGSARTMVAEVTPKPWHPRAFLLLPAAFNVANVAGPILAGLLVDPVVNLPTIFGPNSMFGGAKGVVWMANYPYAAANLMSTLLLFAEAVLVYYGLEETLKGSRPMDVTKLDPIGFVRSTYQQLMQAKDQGFRVLQQTQRQGLLSGQERGSVEMDRLTAAGEREQQRPVQRLPFRRIWTPNVLWTLLSIAIFDFHMGAFANLWILFLATPREFVAQVADRDTAPHALFPRGLFKFSSGLAFPPPTIGVAMATIGFIGVALQFLLYPWANAKFGLMRCFRGSLFFFPLAYFLAPYLALLPSTSPPPDPASGPVIWLGISSVVFLQVAARTFALPASIILMNNSSPHPSVLATIHGIGNACSATFRTLGPMLAGYWYGIWTERGVVGMSWWIVAMVAAVGCVASFKVRNGSGHEIFLPGEEDEAKAAETTGGSGDGR